MLNEIFLQILNLSFTASFVILFVLIARLFLKKAPRWISYALWGVVLFRLICPFTFQGIWSLIPVHTEPLSPDILTAQTPQVSTGLPLINSAINSSLPVPQTGASVNPLQVWSAVGTGIWLAGLCVLLVYSIVSLVRLRLKLVGSVKLRENIYLADHISTPFVFGLIRPKIFLPSSLSEQEQPYILLHEQTHIQRFDHVIKILAFFALCLHWFNPLVWLAFFFCGRDMETSCDESVMNRMDSDIRRDYSASLLSLATGRKIIAGTPLAFGEGNPKSRIKNVLDYRKPAVRVTAISLILAVALGVGLLTNPYIHAADPSDTTYRVKEILYDAPMYSFSYSVETAPHYHISKNYLLSEQNSVLDMTPDDRWVSKGVLSEYELTTGELNSLCELYGWRNQKKIGKILSARKASAAGGENGTFYMTLTDASGKLYLAIGYESEERALIRWIFELEALPQTAVTNENEGIVAVSGNNKVPVVVYPSPLEVPLTDIQKAIYFLDLHVTDGFSPFQVYSNGFEQTGYYRLFDAETLEEISFTHPSGLEPQTYILSSAKPGNSYIVVLAIGTWNDEETEVFGDSLIFGIHVSG